MARDCKKCKYFKCMLPKRNDSFACRLDPYCSYMEYKEKKVCKNYEEKDKKVLAGNSKALFAEAVKLDKELKEYVNKED